MQYQGEKINWGILGCGNIARKFSEALAYLPEAHIQAVGSRNLKKAQEFGQSYQVNKSYGSYEDLVRDPDIDIIYVATPHNFHLQHSLLCLENGKAVLCEKPITVNAFQSRKLVQAAKEHQLFLMEALWMRFLPAMAKLREWLQEAIIGEIYLVKADFCIRRDLDPNSRLFNPQLAGGAMLDVGIYPIILAQMVFGKNPTSIYSTAKLGDTGVDEFSSYVLNYGHGEVALLTGGLRIQTTHHAEIFGTKGSILIPDFWKAQQATLRLEGQDPQTFDFPFECNGYEYEAREVMHCLRTGPTESSIMPLNESINMMQLMDEIRDQWGLKYPEDK